MLLKDTVTTSDQTPCMAEMPSYRGYGPGLRYCSILLTFYQTPAHNMAKQIVISQKEEVLW